MRIEVLERKSWWVENNGRQLLGRGLGRLHNSDRKCRDLRSLSYVLFFLFSSSVLLSTPIGVNKHENP